MKYEFPHLKVFVQVVGFKKCNNSHGIYVK